MRSCCRRHDSTYSDGSYGNVLERGCFLRPWLDCKGSCHSLEAMLATRLISIAPSSCLDYLHLSFGETMAVLLHVMKWTSHH